MTVRPTTGDAYRNYGPPDPPVEPRLERGAELTHDAVVRCDVCVIGAGAGGAPVAKELAEGGLDVVMLEEGPRVTTDQFTARPREMSRLFYRDAGQVVTVGNAPIVLPLGSGIGGTTMINSGTCFRTPESVLGMWGERFGLDELTADELDPYFRRVEREINVVQVPEDIAGQNALVVKRGAEALGWSGDFLWRNVRGCVGSGVCAFGCPTSAKQHVGLNYVPRAWAAGALTYDDCRAERIERDGAIARAVVARAKGGGTVRVECSHVVVSCGAIHTPLFLARQRLGARSGELGCNLAIHPATGVRALFDEEINMAKGVPQSYFIDEFADEGIMFEGAAGPPDYAAMSFPYSGERHRELMLQYRHIAQFGVMVSDLSRGVVRERAGRLEIRYDLNREDTATFKRAIELLCELYFAAGATRVFPPVTGLAELTGGDIEPLRRHEVRAHDLVLMAFHPLGTARADARPDHGVVDGGLKLHDADNVWVADASVIPSSIGVNPQITIMALATRLAYALLDKPAPVDEPEPESIAQPRITRPHALTA
jgi:choline dehydrogenase-like flavoprotein